MIREWLEGLARTHGQEGSDYVFDQLVRFGIISNNSFQYIADLWQKIKDVSTDSNDRKLLRGKLHGYEDCIQKCQCALKDIKAQKKLLDFEREGKYIVSTLAKLLMVTAGTKI